MREEEGKREVKKEGKNGKIGYRKKKQRGKNEIYQGEKEGKDIRVRIERKNRETFQGRNLKKGKTGKN